ncbi:DMT family transporter [Comamonadaceae bacterium G21597-S1]|nr:DMT family transporter [Comamonadaceae bacterium G21597-S1]
MRPLHPALVTLVAMLAFAGNSLLCRVALRDTAIDPASFTSLRIVSGALVLWWIVRMRDRARPASAMAGNWASACALFVYAAAFSFAYVSLATGTGALLLFGAVQATMIGVGLWRGERLGAAQTVGLMLACAGLVGLLLPGLSSPPLVGALLMLASGVAWGIYSLRGKGAGDPTQVTAGNFMRATVPAIVLSLATLPLARLDLAGSAYAIASGALTSGIGYAIWYAALRHLRATTASTVQLSVPVIAALGGSLLLAEPLTARLLWASAAVLGGIALVILRKPAR